MRAAAGVRTSTRESVLTKARTSRRALSGLSDARFESRRRRRAKKASVLTRWNAKRTLVLAAELRRTVVTDDVSNPRDVFRSRQQPCASLLQANLLQVLEGLMKAIARNCR